MLKAIIFDFDGVLCESVDAKIEAFRRLFENHPGHLKRIMDYHIRNGGISRFVKFQVIYRDILKKRLSQVESQRLGEKFSQYCYHEVVAAPLVKGAEEFLDRYHRKIKLFVASGTPQREMRSIVKAKGLGKFFKKIYGSPATKSEIIGDVLRRHKLTRDSVILVGDSINDYAGARQAGIRFVGRIRVGNHNPFGGRSIKTIRDLRELTQWLRGRNFLPA